MEGGNLMGNNGLLKKLFIVALTFILVCLSIIIAGELPDDDPSLSSEINYKKLKFEVLNRNPECEEEMEELYRVENTTYYTYCKDDMYIKWENGEIDLLEETLLENKINIEDLIDKDLRLVVVENDEY